MMKGYIILILYWLCRFFAAEDSDSGSHGVKFAVPKLSQEEEDSTHMPDHLKCDACMAVAFQFFEAFEKLISRVQTPREYEVLEVAETLCMEGFVDYGLKSVNNVNRLSGPGLNTDKVRGMTQLGGKWPIRIREMCHNYLGEVGEMNIFEATLRGLSYTQRYLCFKEGVRGECKKEGSAITEEEAGLEEEEEEDEEEEAFTPFDYDHFEL